MVIANKLFAKLQLLFQNNKKKSRNLSIAALFMSLNDVFAYFTLATIALKASGLFRARSASTLRLISIPALASLPMSTE